ncbi:hemoglobin [Novosphingobium chloroacetimidivorans]|uniref:Hemoglobin n=1 Tax=Novosphingobium chloroacetimidivorans TaxID=1428314 RepID=A0A7W7K9B2_9SPHN|nr:group III truncated hemoglobin [Novosphingobium chloroacetimidivorans]MBB4858602.1 hemoglobin [Novosphingobium chloroacetimidivorans]
MDGEKLVESEIRPVVERFYDRIRGDEALGPVFGAAVHDWDDHHARLADFWSSVMLTSGRYKGNPVALHLRHADALTPAAFERWLTLWAATTQEMLPPPVARAMQAKAARIGESLQLAIRYRRTAA